jgi:hypothetical protein
MAVGLKEVTVNGIVSRFTDGEWLPNPVPLIVIVWAVKSAWALFIRGAANAGKAFINRLSSAIKRPFLNLNIVGLFGYLRYLRDDFFPSAKKTLLRRLAGR